MRFFAWTPKVNYREDALRSLLKNNKLEPYIRSIRFPRFKNLDSGLCINFDYPITALVGKNGTSKSSVLKALYGCPLNKSIGVYWFSTAADPITEEGGDRNCFIYSYYNPYRGTNVEVLKTRTQKPNNPDYWEPSRLLAKHNSTAMPEETLPGEENLRVKTRWNPINKNVEFIDFRSALSAFDQYFYYGNLNRTKRVKSKQDYIRKQSKHLVEAIKNNSFSYNYYKTNKIIDEINYYLSADMVENISKILGKSYTSIKIIKHSFFNSGGYTAKLTKGETSYTEAFAGSGEFAVINIVHRLSIAQEKSLILLDEPEVSLHPGAQEKLATFIIDITLRKKHQIVFATHSPSMLNLLPNDAIKLFREANNNGIALESQEATIDEAFWEVGDTSMQRLTIIVEDILAKEIILRAFRIYKKDYLSIVDVKFYPGGSSSLVRNYMLPYSIEDRKKIAFYLDGDQYTADWPSDQDINLLSTQDEIMDLILSLTKTKLDYPIDGGTEDKKAQQKIDMGKNFLKWGREHVYYLEGKTPEELLFEMKNGYLYSDTTTSPKKYYENQTFDKLGLDERERHSLTGQDIFNLQREHLASITEHEYLHSIAKNVTNALNRDE